MKRKALLKKKAFQRILSVNHECWDDEADLAAAFAADPEIFEWGLQSLNQEEGGGAGGGEGVEVPAADTDAAHVEQEETHTEQARSDGGAASAFAETRTWIKDVQGGGLPLVLPPKAHAPTSLLYTGCV